MKKGDWLKVLKRHKMLTLTKERRITQRRIHEEDRLQASNTASKFMKSDCTG